MHGSTPGRMPDKRAYLVRWLERITHALRCQRGTRHDDRLPGGAAGRHCQRRQPCPDLTAGNGPVIGPGRKLYAICGISPEWGHKELPPRTM